MGTCVWVDASAGVAGDMLAGAFVDAGVPLTVLAEAVEAALPGAVRLNSTPVTRNGLAACKFDVHVLEADAPHRHLSDIRALAHALPVGVRDRVLAVFERLGAAEAAAHGIDLEQVHFHEVGAADSIADIIATCAALEWLGADSVSFGPLELGSGTVRTEHGMLPVPTPAALRLTTGVTVTSTGRGELATPTGLALLVTLGMQGSMPSMRITASGSGAGTKDFEDHANVVRVIVGEAAASTLLLETNVDDMDPRLWPAAIAALMDAGAQDAWLTPIVMKKGRPAHTLSVLCTSAAREQLLEVLFRETTTIGVRTTPIDKVALERVFASVEVQGQPIAVKVAGRNGRIYNVSLEFEDIARAAAALHLPQREVLAMAEAAAEVAGLTEGTAFEA